MSKILIVTRHGIGDAVQLSVVLKHLARYHPDWTVDVATLVGKHSAYGGLCAKVHCCRNEGELNQTRDRLRSEFSQVFDLPWHECGESYSDSPSTKAEYCLRHTFKINPDPDLWNYTINVRPEVYQEAADYLTIVGGGRPKRGGKFPVMVIHYQGNTSANRKNLEHSEARWMCDQFYTDFGLVPLVMDWERPLRTNLPIGDGRYFNASLDHPIWHGTGTGDAEMIAALISQSVICVAIDSGPLHVAAATTTPTIACWKELHPVHYLCPAENVVNLVAHDHARLIRGNKEAAQKFFLSNYQYRFHQSFLVDLYALAAELLSEMEEESKLVHQRKHWIRSDNVSQDLCMVEDVYENDCYHIRDLPIPREVVVDLGACLGTFSKKVYDRNPTAKIIAVECCPDNIPVLKKNVGSFASVVQAACTYEPGQVGLLNAVYPHCNSTGGSMVRPLAEVETYETGPQRDRTLVIDGRKREYHADKRTMRKVTIEDLAREFGFDHIDVLKLDVEESEFSILYGTVLLPKIKVIVGEYHGRERFDKLCQDRFANWKLTILREGDLGLFRLENLNFK